jgi:hypothetical protein
MTTARLILILTCVATAGLGLVFALVRTDQVGTISAAVSALAAVAAVGVAVWTVLRGQGGARPRPGAWPSGPGHGGTTSGADDHNVNTISGVVGGDASQARDVRGGIVFGRPRRAGRRR